ncbi:MAG: LysE family translocator [Pseudomonadota bacterium]
MNLDTLLALVAFAFVSSITPGPNNLMLMASGANFGFRRTLPHMLGVAFGFMFMLLIVGIGLTQLFIRFPASYTVLRVVSVIYLAYLAWKIATASPVTTDADQRAGKPFSFLQAAAFQWVNPKAWIMGLTAISVYAGDRSFTQVLIVTLVFGIVNIPSVSSWAALGQQISRWLSTPTRLRAFNVTMAVLLVGSLVPSLME